MNRVVKILMKRDCIPYEDAYDIVQETKEMILALKDDGIMEYDDIIADNLELEPDYLDDILSL